MVSLLEVEALLTYDLGRLPRAPERPLLSDVRQDQRGSQSARGSEQRYDTGRSHNSVRAKTSLLDNPEGKGRKMKCNLCHGQYSDKTTVLSFQRGGRTVVVEDVPALVCDVCGDELVTEAVAREVEKLLRKEPQGTAPLYRFPVRVPPST